MIATLLITALAFYWLLRETDYLRVRLPIGKDKPTILIERLSWDVCLARYGKKQLDFTNYSEDPICGWDWLINNTHPIPQVQFDLNAGGVSYHFNIKDTVILKEVLAATKYKAKHNGQLHFTRNKLGGLVGQLPPKAH